mmetsp:Transcript_62516/g.179794  ORF Transcript_62516/g.179794 Transcript_62516/m.179794 type:complete len:155 (-) Transcript_62516:213-677(-)
MPPAVALLVILGEACGVPMDIESPSCGSDARTCGAVDRKVCQGDACGDWQGVSFDEVAEAAVEEPPGTPPGAHLASSVHKCCCPTGSAATGSDGTPSAGPPCRPFMDAVETAADTGTVWRGAQTDRSSFLGARLMCCGTPCADTALHTAAAGTV